MKKHIAILGSTGSIGTQALQVIDNHPGLFEVEVLAAKENVDLLVEQALKYIPAHVIIANKNKYRDVADALSSLPVMVHSGEEAIAQITELDSIEIVLTAMVGFSGLLPTLNALRKGKDIALANKETLVVAGDLITHMAKESGSKIYPVDSEHSAIFQCLTGEDLSNVEKIYLTASGGPFRGWKKKKLIKVTPQEALCHPNWCMGNKVTIDSATLMNKGLEAIEAKWLFSLSPDQIKVIIHPQSIIHSIVQFIDGSMKAQMGLPDMRLPIQYALGFPERLPSDFKRLDFTDFPELTFEKPDKNVFGCLDIAYRAMERGGNIPCIMNGANEVAVDAFLKEKIKFTDIPEIINASVERMDFIPSPDYNDYITTNFETCKFAQTLIH
ncbi:MAG: 1-deoxy-D-xylulose-5-phosphate reductoisomerase [Bacteroidales bacterium]|nr:1-deoxy-D-xylulose-5-phosphate reductoisomerase [Bacteroidales bacterium]